MDLGVEVRVEAEVYPTEDPEKVLEAVKKIFPEIDFNVKWLDGSAVVEGGWEGFEGLREFEEVD